MSGRPRRRARAGTPDVEDHRVDRRGPRGAHLPVVPSVDGKLAEQQCLRVLVRLEVDVTGVELPVDLLDLVEKLFAVGSFPVAGVIPSASSPSVAVARLCRRSRFAAAFSCLSRSLWSLLKLVRCVAMVLPAGLGADYSSVA